MSKKIKDKKEKPKSSTANSSKNSISEKQQKTEILTVMTGKNCNVIELSLPNNFFEQIVTCEIELSEEFKYDKLTTLVHLYLNAIQYYSSIDPEKVPAYQNRMEYLLTQKETLKNLCKKNEEEKVKNSKSSTHLRDRLKTKFMIESKAINKKEIHRKVTEIKKEHSDIKENKKSVKLLINNEFESQSKKWKEKLAKKRSVMNSMRTLMRTSGSKFVKTPGPVNRSSLVIEPGKVDISKFEKSGKILPKVRDIDDLSVDDNKSENGDIDFIQMFKDKHNTENKKDMDEEGSIIDDNYNNDDALLKIDEVEEENDDKKISNKNVIMQCNEKNDNVQKKQSIKGILKKSSLKNKNIEIKENEENKNIIGTKEEDTQNSIKHVKIENKNEEKKEEEKNEKKEEEKNEKKEEEINEKKEEEKNEKKEEEKEKKEEDNNEKKEGEKVEKKNEEENEKKEENEQKNEKIEKKEEENIEKKEEKIIEKKEEGNNEKKDGDNIEKKEEKKEEENNEKKDGDNSEKKEKEENKINDEEEEYDSLAAKNIINENKDESAKRTLQRKKSVVDENVIRPIEPDDEIKTIIEEKMKILDFLKNEDESGEDSNSPSTVNLPIVSKKVKKDDIPPIFQETLALVEEKMNKYIVDLKDQLYKEAFDDFSVKLKDLYDSKYKKYIMVNNEYHSSITEKEFLLENDDNLSEEKKTEIKSIIDSLKEEQKDQIDKIVDEYNNNIILLINEFKQNSFRKNTSVQLLEEQLKLDIYSLINESFY